MPPLPRPHVLADVIARTEAIARAEQSSAEPATGQQLDMVTDRADNGRLLDALPDTGMALGTLVAHLDEGRAET